MDQERTLRRRARKGLWIAIV
ncbi:MAG: hypothetical protein RLY29_504, partial [Actinomycetota bacterium]